jgi:hypothetical protein
VGVCVALWSFVRERGKQLWLVTTAGRFVYHTVIPLSVCVGLIFGFCLRFGSTQQRLQAHTHTCWPYRKRAESAAIQ